MLYETFCVANERVIGRNEVARTGMIQGGWFERPYALICPLRSSGPLSNCQLEPVESKKSKWVWYLKYKKMMMAPFMNSGHKKKWLKWSCRNVSRGDWYWANVNFYDNKFKFDGIDGLVCQWDDLRSKETIFQGVEMVGGHSWLWMLYKFMEYMKYQLWEGEKTLVDILRLLTTVYCSFRQRGTGGDLLSVSRKRIHPYKPLKKQGRGSTYIPFVRYPGQENTQCR